MRIICPECGFSREVNEAGIPAEVSFATCPKCAHRFAFRPAGDEGASRARPAAGNDPKADREAQRRTARRAYQQGAAAGGGAALLSPGGSVPWECPGLFMRPLGFARTLTRLVRESGAFFSGINPFSSIIPAWIFLLLCSLPFTIYFVLQAREMQVVIAGAGEPVNLFSVVTLAELIGAPLFLISFYQLIGSGTIYCVTRLLAPERVYFRLIFKVCAYAATPVLLLCIPAFGLPLVAGCAVALLFVGLRHACGLSARQAALALLPFILINFIIFIQLVRVAVEAVNHAPM
ncbi:MAG: zinc-ribbon domain-containing protein [Deltaproteobacteria bacterium]|jgi:hypothetical protein|nr:zinc-ribbon domain-containing protein [Deltaproteobacteria bacterium]